MNRRAFLALSAITPLASWLPAFERGSDRGPKVRELSADLAVIGGGVGGIACALAAAQAGLKVVMSEEFDWIGGQLTSQGVPPDEYPTIETFPCTKAYGQFRKNVRDFYRRNFPLTDDAKKFPLLNPGNAGVSKLCHEPRVAVAVLLELLAPYLSNGRVRLLQPAVPTHVDLDGDRIEAVHLAHRDTPTRFVVIAPYFVDATELGDLLHLSGTEYVTGAERARDHDEPHAPTVEAPRNHQAFTYCFAMDHIDGEDHTIDEPAGYQDWRDYIPDMTPKWPGRLLSWEMSQHNAPTKVRPVDFNPVGAPKEGRMNLWTYRRIADRKNFATGAYAGDISLVNWPQNDYWLGNLFGNRTPAENARHRAAAVQLSLSLLYWMQTEAPRADGKLGWKGLRLRTDLLGTETGVAQAPYVRESRRIKAVFTVAEPHVGVDARAKLLGKKPGEFAAEAFKDSVGIGSYRIDLHPSSGGDNYIDVSSLPFQIPLGALLPVRVENLLPACKNIGTTHITNGCYRLHPVEWSIGEAVGNLLAFCLAKKAAPRQVRKDAKLLADYQTVLTKNGVQLEWPAKVATVPR